MSEEHKRKISESNGLALRGNKNHLGKKHSDEAKEKMSIAKKGKPHANRGKKRPERAGSKSHLWKGGVTPINKAIRSSLEYKLWRTAVFTRDNFACIWEGKEHGSKLHADHIKPFAYYPELRFAIDNGRTLCVECHKKTDSYPKNLIK